MLAHASPCDIGDLEERALSYYCPNDTIVDSDKHPHCLSAAVIILTQSTLGLKRFILAYSLQSLLEGSQDRKLEAGTEADTKEESCLLACSLWLDPPYEKEGRVPRGSN